MMKFWNRKVLAGIAVGLAIAAGTAGMYQMETTKPVSAAAQEQRQAPQFDVNKAAKHIADSFGVDESQVRAAIEDRRDFRDIGRAAALAKLSGKSFQDVLAMKTDSNTWKEVRNALGVTEEAERNLQTERMAEHICQDTTIDRDEAIRLLKDGYSPRDIQAAALLSKASGKDIRDVLGMKKINNSWRDVAASLQVDDSVLQSMRRGPADRPMRAQARDCNPQCYEDAPCGDGPCGSRGHHHNGR